MSQDQRSFDLISDADDEFSAFVDGLGGDSLSRAALSHPSLAGAAWSTGGGAGNVVTSSPATESSQVAASGDDDNDEEMAALEQSLFNLSPELQEKLVQTLVSKLGSEVQRTESSSSVRASPACKDMSSSCSAAAAASIAPASAAGGAAPKGNGSSDHAPVALPLASAVLGAFLTQYAHAHLTHDGPMGKPQPPAARKGIRTQG
jgi:hypothetical protein